MLCLAAGTFVYRRIENKAKRTEGCQKADIYIQLEGGGGLEDKQHR